MNHVRTNSYGIHSPSPRIGGGANHLFIYSFQHLSGEIMSKYSFTVVIEKDEDGMLVAEVPEFKGCYTQGKTMEEVLKNIKEVISLCMQTQKGNISRYEFVGVQKVEVNA